RLRTKTRSLVSSGPTPPRASACAMRDVRTMMVRMIAIKGLRLAMLLVAILPPAALAGGGPVSWEEVARARRTHDFFALRDHLARPGAGTSQPGRVATAFVATAFNQPAASNAAIRSLAHVPG